MYEQLSRSVCSSRGPELTAHVLGRSDLPALGPPALPSTVPATAGGQHPRESVAHHRPAQSKQYRHEYYRARRDTDSSQENCLAPSVLPPPLAPPLAPQTTRIHPPLSSGPSPPPHQAVAHTGAQFWNSHKIVSGELVRTSYRQRQLAVAPCTDTCELTGQAADKAERGQAGDRV